MPTSTVYIYDTAGSLVEVRVVQAHTAGRWDRIGRVSQPSVAQQMIEHANRRVIVTRHNEEGKSK